MPLLPALAVAALLLGLIAQAVIPFATPLPEVAPSRAVMSRGVHATGLPIVLGSMIAARTLFSPTRRINPAGASPAMSGLVSADVFAGSTLIGTARARGYAVAILRDAAGKSHSLRPGQSLGPWRVLAITQGGANFGNGATRRTLIVGETAVVQRPPVESSSEVGSQ